MNINVIIDNAEPNDPRFVEIEDDQRRSISVGEHSSYENGLDFIHITPEDLLDGRRTEWCEIPYGVLGHRGPSSSARFSTKEELLANARYTEDSDIYGTTPARADVVTIDGREYRSRWTLVPTRGQLAAHPGWPAELELKD